MTINELIKQLKEYRKYMGGDAEVRMMTSQSGQAFECTVLCITTGEEINNLPDTGDDDDVEDDNIVYIVEGQPLKFGSRRARNLVG